MSDVKFDEAYYLKFYESPSTRIYDRARHAKLVAGVVNVAEWFMTRVDSVLDVGAGVGWWGQWLKKHRPNVDYYSTELEASACKKYGHKQADIRTFRLARRFDLVISQGVLPYIDDDGVGPAIENLAAMCGGLLYLEAITSEDLGQNVDVTLTDTRVKSRPGSFYLERLRPHFRQVGAGLWAARSSHLVFYELEAEKLPAL